MNAKRSMAHFLSTVACVPLLTMIMTALATTAPVSARTRLSMQSNAAGAGEGEREAVEKFVGPLPGGADPDDEQMRGLYTAVLNESANVGPTDRSHLRLGMT
jgi:hypothetical protein